MQPQSTGRSLSPNADLTSEVVHGRSSPPASSPSGRQTRTAAEANSRRSAGESRAHTGTGRGTPKPGLYGGEPPDFGQYVYGYPPCCGRMFGSGN